MVELERVSWLRPQYVVRDDHGHHGTWTRSRFKETISGDVDGEPAELRRDGRNRFLLMHSGATLATASAGKRGRWAIRAADSAYELSRRSAWRSAMDLRRDGITVGSIQKGKAPRGKVICELPSELSPAAQILIGFLVVTLWNRAAASSAAAASG